MQIVRINHEPPQIHNEYFCHNEPHNDAPIVFQCTESKRIKQSKGLARNQTIKIPQIPLSHPTGFQNQINQNPGKIPGNGKHWLRDETSNYALPATTD